MGELGEDPAAVVADPLREPPHACDPVGVVEAGHPGDGPSLPAADRGRTLHDQPGAGFGARFEFPDEPIDGVVLARVFEQRRAVEPVSEPTAADLDRRLQRHGGVSAGVPFGHASGAVALGIESHGGTCHRCRARGPRRGAAASHIRPSGLRRI